MLDFDDKSGRFATTQRTHAQKTEADQCQGGGFWNTDGRGNDCVVGVLDAGTTRGMRCLLRPNIAATTSNTNTAERFARDGEITTTGLAELAEKGGQFAGELHRATIGK